MFSKKTCTHKPLYFSMDWGLFGDGQMTSRKLWVLVDRIRTFFWQSSKDCTDLKPQGVFSGQTDQGSLSNTSWDQKFQAKTTPDIQPLWHCCSASCRTRGPSRPWWGGRRGRRTTQRGTRSAPSGRWSALPRCDECSHTLNRQKRSLGDKNSHSVL